MGASPTQVALWSLQVLLSDPAGGPPARPLIATTVPAGDPQHCIRFSVNSSQELISNGKRRVYFWSWAAAAGAAFAAVNSGSGGSSSGPVGRFQYYSPPLRSKDFKQSVGDFVMSVFVPGTTQALTGTSDGDLVVWDEQVGASRCALLPARLGKGAGPTQAPEGRAELRLGGHAAKTHTPCAAVD
jgi:hypothetical protein